MSDAQLRTARNVTATCPTPAQASAGNYRKGRVRLHDMDIAIENPRDTIRKGYDEDGKVKWEARMHADYGYFVGTKAVDGDAVDCFIGPHPESEIVIAIDQYDGNKFDETKFVLGVRGRAEGVKLYQRHYPRGWKVGPVTTATVAQLKTWLKTDNTKKPFAGQLIKVAGADKGCLMANFVNGAEIPLWTLDNINSRHLIQDGVEGDPHVTVCYGFDNAHPDDWRELSQVFKLRDEDFKIKLGKIKIFRADSNRPQSDCVVVAVESEDMARLHKLCRDRYGIKSRHGRYNPHLTLAYVKPGKCDHLEGSDHFAGRELRLAGFTWSALGVQRHIVLSRPWYGFDLDGTLAETVEPFDINRIGAPVKSMIRVLKKHLDAGDHVKICTARANSPESIPLIRAWLSAQGLPDIEITDMKDMAMVELYDDRATSVHRDTGRTKKAVDETLGVFSQLGKRQATEVATITKEAKKPTFYMPENPDTLNTHKHYELQGGGNDWEAGITWVWVDFDAGYNGRRDRLWFRVSLPAGVEAAEEFSKEDEKKIYEHGQASWKAWEATAKRILADNPDSSPPYSSSRWKEAFRDALAHEDMAKYVDEHGEQISEFREKQASELGNPNSIGNLLASQIPFLPAGARRAGAAEVMAARHEDPTKRDAGPLVSHPIMSQALAGAAGIGGALAYGKTRDNPHGGILAGLGLGPLLAVNAIREMKVRKIQKEYEESTSRRRLRETKEIDELLRRRSGSSRLGIAHTLQFMRDRKTRNLPALAEVNDWAVMSATPLAWPISVPISQMVDDALSHRYTEKAADKSAAAEDSHWSDSANNPAVPLFFLAGALGLGSQIGADKAFTSRIAEGSKHPFDRRHWRNLAKHITGDPNVVIASPRDSSAYSVSPGSEEYLTDAFANVAAQDPNLDTRGLKDRIRESGLISVGRGENPGDSRYDTAPVISHELGHQAIDRKAGLVRFLQRHLYNKTHLTSAVTPLGSLGAGLMSGGIGRGALLGALIGGVGNSGTLLPEAVASVKGYKGLKSFEGGRHMTPGLKGDLISAYATYAAAHLAPSIIAGGVGGAISAARKKRRIRDEEEMGKQAAASKTLWKFVIEQMKDMSPDLADRLAMARLGVTSATAKRMWRKGLPKFDAVPVAPPTIVVPSPPPLLPPAKPTQSEFKF